MDTYVQDNLGEEEDEQGQIATRLELNICFKCNLHWIKAQSGQACPKPAMVGELLQVYRDKPTLNFFSGDSGTCYLERALHKLAQPGQEV